MGKVVIPAPEYHRTSQNIRVRIGSDLNTRIGNNDILAPVIPTMLEATDCAVGDKVNATSTEDGKQRSGYIAHVHLVNMTIKVDWTARESWNGSSHCIVPSS